jgi:opacity protein-like surface antigen
MKLVYSIFICLFSIALQAQDSIQTDTTKWKKHHVGITYSPEYNFRFLQAESNATWIKNIADSMEAPKFGFSTGVNYSVKIVKKSTLSTGVLFTDNGEKTKSNVNLQTVNYTNHYYFVSVPLRIDYTVYSKKVAVYTTLGITNNFFINHKTVMYEDGKKEAIQFNNHTDLATWNFGGIAGLGMNAKLADNWFFKLEVLYKQSITPVNNDPVKKWLYAVGPNFGLFYSLK